VVQSLIAVVINIIIAAVIIFVDSENISFDARLAT
jgi:hypothetical protein